MQSTSRTRPIVLTGLSIALIAVGSFIAVPFGPVPFTLQTMMLGIVICLLPPVYAVAAVGGYLALGCLGFPIFAGFSGGIGAFAGPTGGFLIGFMAGVILVAILRSWMLPSQNAPEKALSRPSWFLPAVDIASLVIFSLVYYAFGSVWFSFSTGVSLEVAIAACVAPFVIPDILKAVAALICVQPVRVALGMGLVAKQHRP